MYYYVYDEFVQDPKFERELSLIETRVTDLGISGKIARLALFRDPKTMIQDQLKKGVTTVVAVGNDQTLRQVIDAVGDRDVVVAMIPLGDPKQNRIADMFGVPGGVAACDVLSARIVEELDIGAVNRHRFLHGVSIHAGSGIAFTVDESYTVRPHRSKSIEIRNLALADSDIPAANPTDGKLELAIRTPGRAWLGKGKRTQLTYIPFSNLYIECEDTMAYSVDGEEFTSKSLAFTVLDHRLRIVASKDRKF